MAKGKTTGKKDLGQGDQVKVIGGDFDGRTGKIEFIRAATQTACVRLDDGQAETIALTDLAAA